MKVLFENEKEAFIFFDECTETQNDDHDDLIKRSVYHAKEKGYIKKSSLETAREKYYLCKKFEIQNKTTCQYIQELEKEIERLKDNKK